MPRLLGKTEVNLVCDSLSVEDLHILLQGIRDWEQSRGVDIFIGVRAPELKKEETLHILENITPPLSLTFIPIP